MRWMQYVSGLAAAAFVICGCAPELLAPKDGTLIDAIDAIGVTDAGDTGAASPAEPVGGPLLVEGSIADSQSYMLYDLGMADPGDIWQVAAAGGAQDYSTFLLALFDEDYNLLMRANVSKGNPLEHTLRDTAGPLYLGVASAFGRAAGDYHFRVDRLTSGAAIPAAATQVVWLNFGGGDAVSVHRRNGLSFPSFDAAALGSAYADHTEAIKAAIMAAVREDYADYNVVVRSSDEGPPPEGAYATLHFGGYDEALLGLADSVDQYNTDSWEAAIIYAESFADFAIMRLSPAEMGQMIGNTASHELGHLLGLFHTQVPSDVMDTTGTAWDLVSNQAFSRGALESSVFPVGYENSPARLAETLGLRAGTKDASQSRPVFSADGLRKAELRSFVRSELRHGCGTCLHLDDD